MSTRNKSLLGALCVILAGVATALFFLLNIERNEMQRWGYIYFLIADAVFFCGILSFAGAAAKQQGTSVYAGAGAATVLGAYLLTATILAFYATSFELRIFALWQTIALAITAALCLMLFTAMSHISRSNQKADDKQAGGENDTPKRGGF